MVISDELYCTKTCGHFLFMYIGIIKNIAKLPYKQTKDAIMYKINDYMNIKSAAKFLGVTENTLRNWEKNKKIFVYRNPLNKFRLYKKEDLEQLLSNIKQV